MQNKMSRLLLIGLMASVLAAPQFVRAEPDAGVVGTGTPASCTETALNTALAGGGLVTFNCGAAPFTLVLSAVKNIIADTTVDGGGKITLSGNNATRHFFINGGVNFALKNITLANGFSPVGGGALETAGALVTVANARLTNNRAIDQGGAIYCFVGTGGAFTITNSLIDGNTSTRGGAIYNDGCAFNIAGSAINSNSVPTTSLGLGGGVFNATNGVLTVTQSSLSNNKALDGGGLYVAGNASANIAGSTFSGNAGGYGGGIENDGALTMTASTIAGNNVTGSGGGIWNLSGTISMTRSTVRDNSAFEGGGINSYGQSVDLRDVNILNNTATGNGGGIWHSGTTFFARNITISGNRATSTTSDGGGIHQDSSDNLFFVNATIANNSAGRFGGGIYHVARYGIFFNSTFGNNTAGVAGNAIYENAGSGPGRVDLGNSVIFGSANNCDGGMFTTSGHNVTAGTCVSIAHATDQTVSDAKMGPLTNNGGGFAMPTFAPLAGSAAINTGDASLCATYAPTDQRSAARVAVCDAGSVEFGAQAQRVAVPLVVRQ
jgi:predicted outer membrane repeat protein